MAAERTPPVAGVLLAAGTSSRLGRNKLLLDVGSEALVRRSAGRAVDAGLDPVLVVVGHEADRVAAALAGLPVQMVTNPDYASGQASSLLAGIAAVPAGAPAAVVLLADMPLVTAGMIAAVVERYRETGAPVVTSLYGGVAAPPTLYDRALFAELTETAGPGCARRAVARHRDSAVTLDQPAGALADLDSETDLAILREPAGEPVAGRPPHADETAPALPCAVGAVGAE